MELTEIRGELDGAPYLLRWRGDVVEHGSTPNIVAWLAGNTGRAFTLPPTGPTRLLDPTDLEAVATALHAGTTLLAATPELPTLTPPAVPGAVY